MFHTTFFQAPLLRLWQVVMHRHIKEVIRLFWSPLSCPSVAQEAQEVLLVPP